MVFFKYYYTIIISFSVKYVNILGKNREKMIKNRKKAFLNKKSNIEANRDEKNKKTRKCFT